MLIENIIVDFGWGQKSLRKINYKTKGAYKGGLILDGAKNPCVNKLQNEGCL